MNIIKSVTEIVLLCSFVIISGNPCIAQQETHSLSIKGKVKGDHILDSVKLRYTSTFEQQHTPSYLGKREAFAVTDNQFEISIDSLEGSFYLLFDEIKKLGLLKNPTYGLLTNGPLLVYPDMDLEIEITVDSVLFTGKAASLINCQVELLRLQELASDKRRQEFIKYDIFHGEKDDPYNRMLKYMEGSHKIINDLLLEGREVFDSFSKNSNEKVWQQIWYDWVGNVKFYQINNIYFYYDKYSKNYRPAIEDFYRQNILPEKDSVLIASYACNSYMFPQYLYFKSKNDLEFLLMESGTNLVPSFQTLLDLLSFRYQKELFDQVAFSAILKQGGSRYIDENTYLNLASRIENPEYKLSVEDKLVRKSRHRPGYQFALQDNHGKVFTPKDFKGKTVIMDFWYTGCHGCKGLYKVMKPIKEQYLADSSVVVLSVCVDKTKERWLETLSDPQNGYTDSSHINVWVGSNSENNPLIRYYNIFSYPTLILLNDENEILAYNPGYWSDLEKKALVALINQSLKK